MPSAQFFHRIKSGYEKPEHMMEYDEFVQLQKDRHLGDDLVACKCTECGVSLPANCMEFYHRPRLDIFHHWCPRCMINWRRERNSS